MNLIPPALERLIADFSRLPGIGKKTATRLALHLLRRPASEAQTLGRDLLLLHESIKQCSLCFAFSDTDPCSICEDPKRDSKLLCVVEEPADLLALEKTASYRGRYHILHGALSPMDGIGPDDIRVNALVTRVRREPIEEVLIATSSTVPGEVTAAYLTQRLQGEKVRLTRLAFGIPMGMDIKYADELTLAKAVEARKEMLPEES